MIRMISWKIRQLETAKPSSYAGSTELKLKTVLDWYANSTGTQTRIHEILIRHSENIYVT